MDKPIFKPMTIADYDDLKADLREDDLRELMASSTEDPFVQLKRAVEMTVTSGIGFSLRDKEGKLIILFGAIQGLQENMGSIWCMGTSQVSKWGKFIYKSGVPYVNLIMDHFPILYNFCDVRNKTYLKFINRMGFIFYKTHQKHGTGESPFVEFGQYDVVKMDNFNKRQKLCAIQ